MLNSHAPILPGIGLASLQLGHQLPPIQWTTDFQSLALDFSWLDSTDTLRPLASPCGTTIAFVDQAQTIHGLFATPKYSGALRDHIRPGISGQQLTTLDPAWTFRDLDASYTHPQIPGCLIKHREFDIDPSHAANENFDYIVVYNPAKGYFK